MDIQDIVWLVIALLFTFGGGIIKLVKNLGHYSVDVEEPSSPSSRQEWEEEGCDEQELFDEEELEENPYFSYETDAAYQQEDSAQNDSRQAAYTADQNTPSRPKFRSEDDKVEKEQPVFVGNEEFDLRKAIIYQTIMQNDYTDY